MLFIEDRRAAVSQGIAYHALRDKPRGEARVMLELIRDGSVYVDSKTILEGTRRLPEDLILPARDCLRLCDLLIVRSCAEYHRYRELLGGENAFERWIPARELGTWNYRGQASNRVVIWGPGRTAESLALFVGALAPMQAELVVVSTGGNGYDPGRARYVEYGGGGWSELLAGAACVLDASISDPSWSYAFAERGLPLAYAATSGGDEWVRGGTSYLPWDYRTIFAAVASARARGASAARERRPSEEN